MSRGVALAVGLMMVAAACSSGNDASDSSAGSDEPSYLFVVDAESGSVDNTTITLSGVDQSVLQFTDRPYREVGHVDLDDFAKSWSKDGFADDPPNAAISWVVDGDTFSTAVEVTKFEVDGDIASLTYSTLEDTTLLSGAPDTSLPRDFSHVSVVIDSAGTASSSQQISLAVETTTSDSLTVVYDGLEGNQPSTYGNTLFVWEGTSVAWDDPPLVNQEIESNSSAGSATIPGLTPETATYTIGYAVGGSPSAVASTVTATPNDKSSETQTTRVSVNAVEATAIVVSYDLPAGADPNANSQWIGVWEGSTIDPSEGVKPIARADVPGSDAMGEVAVNVHLLRGTTYTVGYFVGEAQTELAATTAFTA